jgi:dinuclear metal center YbgI/SA1388 family protein
MTTVQDVCDFLEALAPCRLAESWDNVGLLVGERQRAVNALMTCLTVTPASAGEAIRDGASLIVAHHPLPFRPLKRLTSDTTPGRLLLQLIGAGVSIYSPHTAFDSAGTGINQRLAEGLGLGDIVPLVPRAGDPQGLGAARRGVFRQPQTLEAIAARLRQLLSPRGMQLVGEPLSLVRRVAVACGSAGEFLEAAGQADCELLVTGETSFHTCLEAQATGVALLLTGHYASERFAVERLADELSRAFPAVPVWASREESDPLTWIP